MQKETVPPWHMTLAIALFAIGSTIVMGGDTRTGQDVWITLLISGVMVFPLLLIFARIAKLLPGMDIYIAFTKLFGTVAGKIIAALITWYSLHLGALVLRNFTEFIHITMLEKTPQTVIMISFLLVSVYLVRSGIKTFAKWSVIAFFVVFGFVLILIPIAAKNMDLRNLLPVMDHSIGELLSSSYMMFSFPLAEVVLFLALMQYVQKGASTYRVYLNGVYISLFALLLALLRNVLTIGPELMKVEYFPSYIVARVISIGDYITRIEGTISINFLLAGLTKITVCLFVSSMGLAALISKQDYKPMIWPSALTMLTLAVIVYNSTMEMFAFLKIYQFYAIPFEIIIPLAVWITAEIRTKRGKKLLI